MQLKPKLNRVGNKVAHPTLALSQEELSEIHKKNVAILKQNNILLSKS